MTTGSTGQHRSVFWQQDGTTPHIGNVRITVRNAESLEVVKVIALNAPNNGMYGWTVPMDLVTIKYVVRVKLNDSNAQDDSAPFKVRPELVVTFPSPNGSVEETKTYSITWVWHGPVPLSTVDIYIRDGASAYPRRDIAAGLPVTGPCTWTVPGDIPKGNYVMYLKVPGVHMTYGQVFNIILPKPHVPAEVKK